MKLFTKIFLSICLLFSGASQAALIQFTGSLDFYDDVDYYYFSVGAGLFADVDVSATGGFNPYVSLWNGPNGPLIAEGNGSLGPNTVGEGEYVIVVGTGVNQPTDNSELGNNFNGNNDNPLQDGEYDVSIDGVNQVDGGDSTQIPEPGVVLFMLIGLLGLHRCRK